MAVGVGILPQPETSSKDFNEAVKERFKHGPCEDARFFDAARQVNYIEALDLILRQVFIDGDFFWQKLRASDGTSRVRFIEGTYVGNVRRMAAGFDQTQWTDGARLDPIGAVSQWRVLNRPCGDSYTDLVNDLDMRQIKRCRRANGVRGVSALAVAANHIHDVMDIVEFTKAGHKFGAQFPVAIYSDRGAGILGALQRTSNSGTGNESTALSMLPGAGVAALKPGEKIEKLTNTFPGDTFSPFMQELRREIAEGVGVPYEVLYNLAEVGGANNRWLLVELQYLLDELQWMLITQFCKPYYQDWLWHEMEAGYLPGAPEDWWRVEFSTPPKPTVDNGRDGKLLLEQMREGFMPSDYVHAMFGNNGADMDEKVVEIWTRRRQMELEAGAQPGEIFGTLTTRATPAISAPAAVEPPQPSDGNDPNADVPAV